MLQIFDKHFSQLQSKSETSCSINKFLSIKLFFVLL